jgi:hypothetical protein
MALVVEDGTGLVTANAYIAQAFADTYHTDRLQTQWSDATTPEKEAAIIRATDYIDKRFGRRFIGFRGKGTQALEWPRTGALDDDGYLVSGLPTALEKACAEYALRAWIYKTLAPDPLSVIPAQDLESGAAARGTSATAGEVLRTKEVVGPLEEEKWYESTTRNQMRYASGGARGIQSGVLNDYNIPEYPEADLLIEPFLKPSSTTLARA